MTRILDDRSLDSLFRAFLPCRDWLAKPVSEAIIEAVWELAKLPPTSSGAYPARIVFVQSPAAKARLLPALVEADRASSETAPITAILGHAAASDAAGTLLCDATLQAGYLIIAARALGLDCAPLALLDPARVDREFFADGAARCNFACNLGYGDPEAPGRRTPGPGFEVACRTV
jgi:3-hydroxypropanoate dehydrogenase